MRVLVTGGAGYIGSHVVHALSRDGHGVLVVDDLSKGRPEHLPPAVELVVGDVCSEGLLVRLSERWRAEALLHLAGRIEVGESEQRPDLYYAVNVGGAMRAAEAARARHLPLVFASSASVYGGASALPIPVDAPCAPANPYARSKHIAERILADTAQAAGFPMAVLRFFNAAGADVEAGLGEHHDPETHLIPRAVRAAIGRGPPLALYGEDWPTADGTCVRDYVHVLDLADAHLRALEHLVRTRSSLLLNLGSGHGTSVRQVLDAIGRQLRAPVPTCSAPRRAGDVAVLVAEVSAAREQVGWQPRRSTIERMVEEALAVERRGYARRLRLARSRPSRRSRLMPML